MNKLVLITVFFGILFSLSVLGQAIDITNIANTSINFTEYQITWTTTDLANGTVYYGLASFDYTSDSSTTFNLTSHNVTLSNLLPNTTYYYYINITNSTDETMTNASEEFSFTTEADQIAPILLSNSTSQSDYSYYTPQELPYLFFTLWDEYNMSEVKIEHNFNGSLVNYTEMTNTSNAFFIYNYPVLAAGNYTWRMYAIDAYGNIANTSLLEYHVLKVNSSFNLTLNSTAANRSIGTGDSVLIEAIANSNYTSDDSLYSLFLDGSLINESNGHTPFSNISVFNTPGLYNITLVYNESQNFTSFSASLFINVSNFLYWSNPTTYPGDNSTYSPTATYKFNVSWFATDLSTVTIEHNFTGNFQNITDLLNSSNTVFYYDYGRLAAGTYMWRMFANDSFGNSNYTGWFVYNVLKAVPSINFTLNGTPVSEMISAKQVYIGSNLTIEAISNSTFTSDGTLISVYMNSTLMNETNSSLQISNITMFNMPGIYNISLIYNESQNYSAYSASVLVNVTDPVYPSWSGNVTYPASGSYYDPLITYMFNVTWIAEGTEVFTIFSGIELYEEEPATEYGQVYSYTITPLAVGNYTWKMYTTNSDGFYNETYNFSYEVLKAQPSFNITINGDNGNISVSRGESVIISAFSTTNFTSDDMPFSLYLNGILTNQNISHTGMSNTTIFSTQGIYNITLIYNESQNYTAYSMEYFINVTEVVFPPVWTANSTFPVNNSTYDPSATYQFNVTWQGTNITVWIEHDFNSTLNNYTISGNESNVYYYNYSYPLAAGIYNWSMYANDSLGNMTNTGVFTYNVLRAAPQISLTLNGSANNILGLQAGSIIEINATLITGEGNITLFINGTEIGSGSNISNNWQFNSTASYNVTVAYAETQNYSGNATTLFVNVTDMISPYLHINSPLNFSTVSGSVIEINYTLNETNLDKVWYNFSFNPVPGNFTPTVFSGINLQNVTFTTPGKQIFYLFANDTSGNTVSEAITVFVNISYEINAWKNVVISNIPGTDIDAFNISGSAMSGNISVDQQLTLGFNLSEDSRTALLYLVNFTGLNATWSTNFLIELDDTYLESVITSDLSGQFLDYVYVKNLSNFINETNDYFGKVVFPHSINDYDYFYYCSQDDLSDCETITACLGGYGKNETTACYGAIGGNTVVYVPHFSAVIGTYDNTAPLINITSPLNNSIVTSSYQNSIAFTCNENATCKYSLDNDAYINLGNGTSFSAYYNVTVNTMHNLTFNCTDFKNNSRLSKINFTINDTTPPSISSLSDTHSTSTASGTFTTEEPANKTVTIPGFSPDTSALYSLSHSFSISDLSEGTEYTYNITVCDRLGNCNSTTGSETTSTTPSNDDDDNDSPPSGGSPGGSSSGSQVPSDVLKVNQVFNNPVKGQLTMNIVAAKIALTQIIFTLKNNVAGSILMTVEKKDNAPVTLDGKIFQYLKVDESLITDTNISSVIIKFRVTKSWISSNNIDTNTISLFRYNNIWASLTTTKTGEDSTYVYYQATSPGLSYFAIKGRSAAKKETSPLINEENATKENIPTGDVIKEVSSTGTNLESGKPKNMIKLPSKLMVVPFMVLGLLIIGGGITFFIYQKNMTILSDAELRELKIYVERCKAEGIEYNHIKEALLKVGWPDYIVDMAIHDVHIPHEDMDKLVRYVIKMRDTGKKDDEIKENLIKVGWQKEVISETFGTIQKNK